MDTKHWLDSTTIKANLVGIVPAVYAISRVFGLHIQDGLLEEIVNGIAATLTLISLVGVFIGRFKANQPLTLEKK